MENCFLEELLAPRRDNSSWAQQAGIGDFFPNGWSFDSFDANPNFTSFLGFSEPTSAFDCPFNQHQHQPYPSFLDGFTSPALPVSVSEMDSSPFPQQEDYPPSMVDDEELGLLSSDHQQHSFDDMNNSNNNGCKAELEQTSNVFTMGLCGEKKGKPKKLDGQPSKNLMAERRRRKRLNDRLSMLRSIVPKISKMDRTSILGDTIDYMKELLERINNLQEEEETEMNSNKVGLLQNFKDLRPNEVMVRNSPKFEVDRREDDTRIDICCAAKPGLLLSTVTTLEALGIEIQQCVISCFNDFSMQASCSEVAEQRQLISSEDLKQELFRNAGYGGRCM